MFNQISDRFETIFKNIRGLGKINDSNIEEASREVRRALLEADVNFKVAKNFVNNVKEKAQGVKVLKSIKPGEQFVKIIHHELVALLGEKPKELELKKKFSVIMLAGLQGAGKTTTAGKLAKFLQNKNYSVMLSSVDIYRPGAIEQLRIISKQVGVDFYSQKNKNPIDICKNAVKEAKNRNHNLLILDTAGRNHIDDNMMTEIINIHKSITPDETLFVADGMTGQDAVKSAHSFNASLDLSGIILTKLDGDSRGGAAVSITGVTGVPIKFIGNSEKLNGLERFDPKRIADRILGFGDILSIVEKAQNVFDEKETKELQLKILKNSFDLNDFKNQLSQMKKMGPMNELIGLMPGLNSKMLKSINLDERQLEWTEAIINSMTIEERKLPDKIDGSRRLRISKGCGRPVQEVNSLLKQFHQMKKMMKKMGKFKNTKMPSIGNFGQF
jgi:signal recognition particle subunit SRP54